MDLEPRFIPALGHAALTPLYDGVVRLFLRDGAIKRVLATHLALSPNQRVLDLGCGTGTVMLLLKQAHPAAQVTGVDGDTAVLRIAARKVGATQSAPHLTQGLADALPFPAQSFDRVVASLVFHHLARPTKRAALREVARVLRANGSFHLLDFGPPANRMAALLAHGVRRFEETADHLDGALPEMLQAAGAAAVGPEDTTPNARAERGAARYAPGLRISRRSGSITPRRGRPGVASWSVRGV